MSNSNADNSQAWILPALKRGLQQLICLGLDGQPSADLIAGTLIVWERAIRKRRVFEQLRDEPRFEEAFLTLAERFKRWPVPSDFLDALPRIVEHSPKILRIDSDAQRERSTKHIAEILAKLDRRGGDGGEAA